MAQIALRKTASENEEEYPQAALTLKNNVYMDDICESVDDVATASTLMKEIDHVLHSGGFKVKGWMNSGVQSEHTESKIDVSKTCLPEHGEVLSQCEHEHVQESPLSKHPHPTLPTTYEHEKILGVKWYPETDEFSFTVNVDICTTEETKNPTLTKRIILSNIARIFDPIGFAAAFLIKAKIGMQKLWQKGLDWDDELPRELHNEWITFFREMNELSSVAFKRSMRPSNAIGSPSLCVFSDASNDAFGTCVYMRWKLSNGYYGVRFVAGKSRVAPLKELSIPRLELQAAIMAVRLYKIVTHESRLHFENVYFFTDSMIVLAWIRDQGKRYKPFVSVRIGEIQSSTDPTQWRHIPGEVNVADDVSRGICPSELGGRWKNGPAFMGLPEEQWPEMITPQIDEQVDTERRKQVFNLSTADDDTVVINCKDFSSWQRLVRVTALVLRLAWNIKVKRNNVPTDEQLKRAGPLAKVEIDEAEMFWIKQAQHGMVERIKDFKMLSPFVGAEGEIRVGGRLDKATHISYDTKHPVLLPSKHWISTLITRYYHELGHTGVAATVAKIKYNYWIIKAHDLAKTVKFRCTTCRKLDAKSESQVMADLPEQRIAPYTPAFHYTSCDYFGPYTVKVGRNKTTKHYGVLFTCLNTRAVHLELAVDYSTQEFLQVLRRFFSIRGVPARMISDNGSQLVGAEKELRAMVKGWDRDILNKFCANRQMEWRFTTPLAPHHNGCAESLVKSCKRALKIAIGEQVLSPFELYTCLMEVSNLVNQRPIGRVPNDPDDGSYICPNDMLLGRSTSHVPQGPFRETKNPRHRVEFVQKIVDSFWRRWTRDVFPSLMVRKKWQTERRNVQTGDVVIVAEPNALRGHWVVGKILDVYPGPDGRVRSVQVKTGQGVYTRPITKLVVIHPVEGYPGDIDCAAPEDVLLKTP